jgi:sugar phosphate isomerase/epimerase
VAAGQQDGHSSGRDETFPRARDELADGGVDVFEAHASALSRRIRDKRCETGKRTEVLVGAMNNPALPLAQELQRIAASGFDFVDVTLEPPAAWPVSGDELARLLRDVDLPAVGHTPYYLPIASFFPDVRTAAHATFHALLDVFAEAGVTPVNVHPDPLTRLVARDVIVGRNAEAIAELADAADARGQRLLVENLGALGTLDDLRTIFAAAPSAAFHLDVGHANLGPNSTEELVSEFGGRLLHVHVSDNFGADDLHLPLGAGSIDWPRVVAVLKLAGWDGTVTLEIFTPERAHLEMSRRLWLEWWEAGG